MATAAGPSLERGSSDGAATPNPGAPPEGAAPARRDPSLARLARAILPDSLGDLGFEIPWQQRLSTKLFAMITVVALATVGAFFYAEILVQRHLLVQVVEESDLLSH